MLVWLISVIVSAWRLFAVLRLFDRPGFLNELHCVLERAHVVVGHGAYFGKLHEVGNFHYFLHVAVWHPGLLVCFEGFQDLR